MDFEPGEPVFIEDDQTIINGAPAVVIDGTPDGRGAVFAVALVAVPLASGKHLAALPRGHWRVRRWEPGEDFYVIQDCD